MDIKDFWDKDFLPANAPTSEELSKLQIFIKQQQGWIYIMTNKQYPHLVKIGMTRKDNVFEREKSINNTGIIDRWRIEYADKVYWARHVESAIHQQLKNSRFEREFFELPLATAIDTVEQQIQHESGILGKFLNLDLLHDDYFILNGFYVDEWINASPDF